LGKQLNFWLSKALVITLGLSLLTGLGCNERSGSATIVPSTSLITPGWTIPAPPNASVNQAYTASVPAQAGSTYVWSVATGSATLINPLTATVTFTPTAVGRLVLQCVITNAAQAATTYTYSITAANGAVLNANPDTISVGQGTLLLATFAGTTGIINPGQIPVTSNVGITVSPAATTTYVLNVDGTDVAETAVTVKVFVPKSVYVANNDSSISAFSLDSTSGTLTEVGTSPYPATCDQVVSDPDGKFLFASGHLKGVYAYKIDSATGILTPVTGSPFATDAAATTYSVATDPKGRFLYASSDSQDIYGSIYGFTLDSTTGVLTPMPGSPFATGSIDRGEIMVHPSGKYLYAALTADAKVDAFSIDQVTGALTELDGAPYDTNVTEPIGVAVNPTGAYFFTKGEQAPSLLAAYAVDIATGALTAVTGSPFGTLLGSSAFHGLNFHPTLNVLYTAFYNSGLDDAGAYSLDLGTGSLQALPSSPYNLFANHGSDNITVDRSGQFAFSTCWGNTGTISIISRMRVDNAGNLTKLDGTPLGVHDVDTTPVGVEPDSIVVTGILQDQ